MKRLRTLLTLAVAGPAVAALLLAGAGRAATRDMTELARKFPRHKGPTMLYVNFDGWRNYDGKKGTIHPFQAMSNKRDQDVQLLLFRTAEMFAPFDVQVVRAFGNGRYDRRPLGNTTVFVGANTAHVSKGKKFTRAHTPARFVDLPGQQLGDKHLPNSNPFDLAFVDPVEQQGDKWVTRKDARRIAGSIAHEAGRTFGLARTLSKPVADTMSYDAPNRFFANKHLPISGLKQGPRGPVSDPLALPRYRGSPIATQNSFTYLWATLGPRPGDDYANVADLTAVDPVYRDAPLPALVPGSSLFGTIDRRGDYDVFQVRQAEGQRLTVWVRPRSPSRLVPVILVFDEKGRELLGYHNGRGQGGRVAQVLLPTGARGCKVVVGGADGATYGAYDVGAFQRK